MKCSKCGTELTMDMAQVNICFQCGTPIETYDFSKDEEMVELELNRKLSQHMVTSGFNFEGYRIVEYKGLVSGQVVIGTGVVEEVRAGISDVFGRESHAFAAKLDKAKELATRKLIMKSLELDSNAIIGIDFDYITFSHNMLGVSANGTSVMIEKVSDF